MTKRLLCLLTFALLVPAAIAQSNADLEPVLLPLSLTRPIQGAFASLWMTDFWIVAVAGDVGIRYTEQCGACTAGTSVPANFALHNGFGNNVDLGETPGEMIYLVRSTAGNARFSLRVVDLSRESQTWGTEVPVVRESQFRSSAITLVNVPPDSRFRVTLRAYDPDAHEHASFRFDFWDMQNGTLLTSRTINAIYTRSGYGSGLPRLASYAQIGDLAAAVPELVGIEAVRVDVSPLDEVTRFWAFASVTNNETQHVTLVTPQQEP